MKKSKPMTRSENMARVKNKNTQPEVYLRKLLWYRGFRYRLNYKSLPGSPDIYIPKYKVAIFVNGCFNTCMKIAGMHPSLRIIMIFGKVSWREMFKEISKTTSNLRAWALML